MKTENEIPRRNRLDLNSPAELAIYKAMGAVEKMSPDVRLTNAVIKLQEARSLVADFIDAQTEDIWELVENCKLVRERSEPTGHDCWGNLEFTSYKYVVIEGKNEDCWDGWYVRHNGKEVKKVTPEFLYKRK